MKTRTGFVSNSSSSSFIISWPREPKSVDDVYSMMFHEGEFAIEAYDDPIDPLVAAQRVWEDIQAQLNNLPQSRVALVENMEAAVSNELYTARDQPGYSGELPDPYESGVDDAEQERRRAAEDVWVQAEAVKRCDSLLQQEGFICTLEYSDNEGAFSTTMEFGDVFRQLKNTRISHH